MLLHVFHSIQNILNGDFHGCVGLRCQCIRDTYTCNTLLLCQVLRQRSGRTIISTCPSTSVDVDHERSGFVSLCKVYCEYQFIVLMFLIHDVFGSHSLIVLAFQAVRLIGIRHHHIGNGIHIDKLRIFLCIQQRIGAVLILRHLHAIAIGKLLRLRFLGKAKKRQHTQT